MNKIIYKKDAYNFQDEVKRARRRPAYWIEAMWMNWEDVKSTVTITLRKRRGLCPYCKSHCGFGCNEVGTVWYCTECSWEEQIPIQET